MVAAVVSQCAATASQQPVLSCPVWRVVWHHASLAFHLVDSIHAADVYLVAWDFPRCSATRVVSLQALFRKQVVEKIPEAVPSYVALNSVHSSSSVFLEAVSALHLACRVATNMSCYSPFSSTCRCVHANGSHNG